MHEVHGRHRPPQFSLVTYSKRKKRVTPWTLFLLSYYYMVPLLYYLRDFPLRREAHHRITFTYKTYNIIFCNPVSCTSKVMLELILPLAALSECF